jgi:hypothetical protein
MFNKIAFEPNGDCWLWAVAQSRDRSGTSCNGWARFRMRAPVATQVCTAQQAAHQQPPIPQPHVLAIDAAGKVPYWSGLYSIDVLGLNDAVIAHEPQARAFLVGHSKFDPEYVFSRRPVLIASYLADGDLNLEHGFTREQ